jgi:short-subunit dehydrogenase
VKATLNVQSGVVVNVTSSVTLKPLPLVGIYRAAKAAVNAFTESLASEVEPFGVQVRIVLPGSSGETSFRDTARARLRGLEDDVYGEFMKQADRSHARGYTQSRTSRNGRRTVSGHERRCGALCRLHELRCKRHQFVIDGGWGT